MIWKGNSSYLKMLSTWKSGTTQSSDFDFILSDLMFDKAKILGEKVDKMTWGLIFLKTGQNYPTGQWSSK